MLCTGNVRIAIQEVIQLAVVYPGTICTRCEATGVAPWRLYGITRPLLREGLYAPLLYESLIMALVLKQKSLEPHLPQQWNLHDDTAGNVYAVTINPQAAFTLTVPVKFRLIPMHGGDETWHDALLSVRERSLVLRAPENLLFHHDARCCEIEITPQALISATQQDMFNLSQQLFIGQVSRTVAGLSWDEARAIQRADLTELDAMVGMLFMYPNSDDSYYLQPRKHPDHASKRIPVKVDSTWLGVNLSVDLNMFTVSVNELVYLTTTLNHLS